MSECSRKELAVSCEKYKSQPRRQNSWSAKETPPKGYSSKKSGKAAVCSESMSIDDCSEPKDNCCELELPSKMQESAYLEGNTKNRMEVVVAEPLGKLVGSTNTVWEEKVFFLVRMREGGIIYI